MVLPATAFTRYTAGADLYICFIVGCVLKMTIPFSLYVFGHSIVQDSICYT
jgi:hypothetical protein